MSSRKMWKLGIKPTKSPDHHRWRLTIIRLVQHGINVHIYEAALALSEIGGDVAFGVNMLKPFG